MEQKISKRSFVVVANENEHMRMKCARAEDEKDAKPSFCSKRGKEKNNTVSHQSPHHPHHPQPLTSLINLNPFDSLLIVAEGLSTLILIIDKSSKNLRYSWCCGKKDGVYDDIPRLKITIWQTDIEITH